MIKEDNVVIPESLDSLHRYFIWADEMRLRFEEWILKEASKEKDIKTSLYLSLWYAFLYVVVEGWKRLNLKDPSIDLLLESPLVKKLKQYRNGVFHFQPKYDDQRLQQFYENDDSVEWIRSLHASFSTVLLSMLKARKRIQ